MQKFLFIIVIQVLVIVFLSFKNSSISAECRLCPEIMPVKILLKNGVIRKGHIAIDPEEELSTKPERSLEVTRRAVKIRLYLSLHSLLYPDSKKSLTLEDLNFQMPHLLHDKVYMDILYKDIAKIELLENLEK
ncbi:MAG: hypothetical protein KBA66_09390 [Leptospiraceae bacterium]|nr:hypothetical protein [Leptospiraceae bacterium]